MQEGEAELQRRKKLTVESEGKFFWKGSSDELPRKEHSPQETNRKFRKVQLHGDDDDGANLVKHVNEQKDGNNDDSKSSQESFLQQGISRHRLVFATASPFHSYRSLAISSLVLVALAVAVAVFCRKASRSRVRRHQLFTDLGPDTIKKPPAEVKEKGGFSYVELNEKRSPGGPGAEAANSWASGLASGLAAVAATPFGSRRSPRDQGSRRDMNKLK